MNDESAHPAGTGRLWGESWYFDFATPDCGLGGYLRLGTYPNLGVGWFWLALVGGRLGEIGRVHVVEHRMALPADDGKDVVIADQTSECRLRCEVPYERWSVRAAAADGVRLDLRWRATMREYRYQATTRYEQSASVAGEVTVGGARFAVEAPGQRDHSWGVRDWWRIPWMWIAAHLEDGTRLHVTQLLLPRPFPAYGYVAAADGRLRPVDRCRISATPEPDGTCPERTELSVGRLDAVVAPRFSAPIRLDGPDGQEGTLFRALSEVETADGRVGSGWLEWNMPAVRQIAAP